MTKKTRQQKEKSIPPVGSETIPVVTALLGSLHISIARFRERKYFFSAWNWSRLFFIISFAIFFLAKFSLSALPITSRTEPVEPDDAYRYMAQAVVMQDCFAGDCAALNSLDEQIQGDTLTDQVAFRRLRVDMHLFNYFHPVYSLLFNLFHGTGLDLVQAYNLIYLGSAILILAVVAAWMLTLWGPIPAGIGLLLLSSYVLTEAGLHVFVPSNMSLGLGMASWTLILRNSKSLLWSAPLLWIAAIGMHSMGLLHVTAAILLLLLSSNRPLERVSKRLIIVGFVLLALRVSISWILPEFSLVGNLSAFYFQTPSISTMIANGLQSLAAFPKQWANYYWSYYALALFLIIGFLTFPREQRPKILAMGMTLSLVFIASTAYFHPVHGNTATARMWTPLFFFLSGAVGNFVHRWFLAIVELVKSLNSKASVRLTRKSTILSDRGWQITILLLIGLVMAQSFSNYVGIGVKQHRLTLENSTQDDRVSFDKLVIEDLKNRLGANESVFFTQEGIAFYALANGLLQNELVLSTLLSGTEQNEKFILNNQSLSYSVLFNPVARALDYPSGSIVIDPEHNFSFSSLDPLDPSTISVWLENSGEEMSLAISYMTAEGQVARQIEVPAQFSAWASLPATNGLVAEVTLENLVKGEILIHGISLSPDQETNWPWDKGIEFTYADTQAPLSSDNLLSEFGLQAEIISDIGTLLLLKIIR